MTEKKYNWQKHLKDTEPETETNKDFWKDNTLKRELGLSRIGNNHWNRSNQWKRK